jgi:hypothetical protein
MDTTWSSGGTARAQGVVQVWSWLVWISAPGGSDSKFNDWSCSDDEEFDDSAVEQPASAVPRTPAIAAASPRRTMTLSYYLLFQPIGY